MSFEEVSTELTNTQLKKLKSAVENETVKTLRITKKNIQDEALPHQLLLTTIQKTKTRNAFPRNMLEDLKVSEAQ